MLALSTKRTVERILWLAANGGFIHSTNGVFTVVNINPPGYNFDSNQEAQTAILNKEIEIGMTERQVRISIGNPDELNHTSSRHGMAEQWVYGVEMGEKVYYQFENGKLTFINK